MNNFIRWVLHIVSNTALQTLVIETVHTEPWLHVVQIAFLIGGLSLAYLDPTNTVPTIQ